MIQGSPEWLAARCGKVTASEFSAVMAKSKEAVMRSKYLRRLAAERLTGKPMETYATGSWAKNLERGHEQEPYARMAYEERTGLIVNEVGLIDHATLKVACSPDGLIGDDGGAEIKSVIPTTQLETILAGAYPTTHKAQVQGSLWVTGRKWWDFCSFSPDMPEKHRLYVFRVNRDDEYIKTIEAEVLTFLADMEKILEQLEKIAA